MNEDVKREWVAALRSGEYKQGTGLLRNGHDRFCCLGVLCDLAVKHGVIPKPERDDKTWVYVDGDEEMVAVAPQGVADWAGLCSGGGRLPETIAGQTDLWGLNDHARFDFHEIADVIERYL